jgi:dihydropyrimidine dehydrogenase (NAD+) subunit PreA
MAPVSREAWQDLVRELQDTPIDAFELNFSCPHGMPERGMGMAIGTDSELSARITMWVKSVSRVPIFVKLSPNVTDIAAIANAVKTAGADGIAAINTVQCLMGVDLDTLSPLPAVGGRTAFGGYSGQAVKPIGLRCVAQCKQATGLPIFAMGGISTWYDAAEYLAVGGDAVQVCTEVMLNGYAVIHDFLAGLRNYLAEKGFASTDPLRGAALDKIVTHQEVAGGIRRIPALTADICRDCGKCAIICAESGYQAIRRNEEGRWSIASDTCDGCGLCVLACSTRAIVQL